MMNRSQLIFTGGIVTLAMSSMAMFVRSEPNVTATLSARSDALQPPPTPGTNSSSSPTTTPAPPLPIPSTQISPTIPPDSSVQPVPAIQPTKAIDPNYQAHRITTCGGEASNAYFRAYPSLVSTAILGAVRHGDLIYLTGRTTYENGIVWHEAIAPTLFPVPDPEAQNHTEPNQMGWVASCFISG